MGTHMTRLVVVVGLLFVGFSVSTTLFADSVEDFECQGAAIHVYEASLYDGAKEIEHYCELPNGKRQGLTKISHTHMGDTT